MKVVKRSGKSEQYNCKKIKKAIAFACDGLNVNPLKLEAKFDEFLFDGVTSEQIQQNLIIHAKNLATPTDDDWVFVAGRLAVMDLWNKTKAYEKPFNQFIHEMVEKGVYKHPALGVYSDEEIIELGKEIDKSYDLKHSISSFNTFKSKYLVEGECIQLVQMVDAMIYASVEKTKEQRMYYAKRWYHILANRELSKATPHWTGLRFGESTGSCFVLAVGDDIDSIMDNAKRTAKISKDGGGVGTYWGYVRAKGDMIGGEYGLSGGVIPMMKIFNETIVAFNQRGKRKGAITSALPIWHKDVVDFLDVKTEVGDLRGKLFDTQTQIVIEDIFMNMKEEDNQQIWYTFSPHEVEVKLGFNLNDYSGKEFDEKYLEAVNAYKEGLIRVVGEIKIADLWRKMIQHIFEKGVPYVIWGTELQYQNPNKHCGKIHSLNLCVAPETKILTENGYQIIEDLSGQDVTVWNGFEWSDVKVVKTGENQKLLKVVTSGGQELEATEYHKWYVMDGYNKTIEKRTHELRIGDKLIKFELPLIEGSMVLENAYSNGMFSGDGCVVHGKPTLYLYHGKRNLIDHLTSVKRVYKDEKQSRDLVYFEDNALKDKYFVPVDGYTIESRLKWFAGLCDSDGTIARNGTNEGIQVGSIHLEFLKEVQLMLQTLGVTSKVTKSRDEGYNLLPKNDGSGENAEYLCKQAYRLLVSSSGLFKLAELGFETYRLKWTKRLPQRSAEQFITIVDIVDEGRFDDTYCFTEFKRNLGMFNGILTGQCVESSSNFVADQVAHTCSLLSIVAGRCTSKEDVIQKARDATRILANNLELTSSPVDISGKHIDQYRTIGVGIQGLVDYLAKNDLLYSDLNDIRELSELIQYGCVVESMELAKERGAYPLFKGSRWDTGEQFEAYIENSVSDLTDWVWLRDEVKKHGVYCSQHTSPAPNTSTSIAMDAAAGVMPSYAEFFFEDNVIGKLPVTSMYLKENPLLYSMTFGMYDQLDLVDSVSELQKYVDTSISAEYVLDRNVRTITAQDIADIYNKAWQKKTKAVYYLRTIKEGESVVDKSSECSACAG